MPLQDISARKVCQWFALALTTACHGIESTTPAQGYCKKDSPNCSNSVKLATQKRCLRDYQAAADLTIIRAARMVVVSKVSVRVRTSTTSPTFRSLKVAGPFGVAYVVLSLTLTVTVLCS